MVYMNKNYITSEKTIQHICKKMTPPLGNYNKNKFKNYQLFIIIFFKLLIVLNLDLIIYI